MLFQTNPLDNKGNFAMDPKSRLDLETDGIDDFFICPHCKTKNVVTESKSKSGLSQLKISHTKQ